MVGTLVSHLVHWIWFLRPVFLRFFWSNLRYGRYGYGKMCRRRQTPFFFNLEIPYQATKTKFWIKKQFTPPFSCWVHLYVCKSYHHLRLYITPVDHHHHHHHHHQSHGVFQALQTDWALPTHLPSDQGAPEGKDAEGRGWLWSLENPPWNKDWSG